MRSKRLLTMLLAIVMVFSVLSPAANAVVPAKNSVLDHNHEESGIDATAKVETSGFDNKLVLSPDGAADQLNTLRDKEMLNVKVEEAEVKEGEGSWSAVEVDKDLNLTLHEVPDCIEELQAAAEVFEKDEKVAAFVVMEAAPLAETHNSISRVTPAQESELLANQNVIIDEIETKVLAGNELNVRYQFTYLTNAFTIETEFQNLEKIAKMDGIKSVFVMPVYEPCTTNQGELSPLTSSAGEMTGVHQVWNNTGYTGQGMKIAVIDTGLDLDHPSFAADPVLTDSSMTEEDIAAVLKDLNAYAKRSTITAATLHRSAKVPFAFNYVDANLTADHSADQQGDHGTHVAGIAAANALEGTSVVGMAPDAQIIVMKVFGANGGAYMDDIVAALEDAMTLGCDVVNASLGSPAGFSSSDSELDLIYERLDSQDIVACYSAGNEGTSSYMNMWGTDLNRTQNPDNATIGSPALYANVLSIASAENAVVKSVYFSVGENDVFYMDPYQYYFCLNDIAGSELEYVIIEGLGLPEDYYDAEGNSLVEGKVAVVKRGETSFASKIMNAEAAGAAACLVWNNQGDDIYNFGMQISEDGETYPMIPSALIGESDGQMMADAEVKIMSIATEMGDRISSAGGQMSSFSSWGVSPDLRLVPDITGIGGNVYSCYDGGVYGLMSGTSMSSPQVAGVTALVMQRLYEIYPDAPEGTIRELALALMMSTADPIIGSDSGVEASPRQQGAGLVDAYEAVTSDAYLTVGGDRPKAELGDSSTGVYKFSFEIHNIGEEDKTYVLDASLLTEAVAGMQLSETEVEYFMYGMDMPLSGSVTFNKNVVTVPAGGKSNVTVTVSLSDEDKALFEAAWENGGYVEGYVYLANEEGEAVLNLPFLGFYGDWTEAPVFDTAYWYDNSFWGAAPANGLPEGDEYHNVMWTNLAGTDWVLGFNPYSGALQDQNGNMIYDPAHNILSPNGDGALDGLSEIYLSLLRNAKTLTITYSVDGEILDRETITNNSKTMYRSNYGQVVPWIYSWYGSGLFAFNGFFGLETGTEVLMTVDANVDYGTGGDHTIQIPIYIDVTKPVLEGFAEMPQQDGTQILGVQVADETAFASVVLMSPSGSQIYAQAFDVGALGDPRVVGMGMTETGSYVVYFDVTDLGTDFLVAVCDYGANESYYEVEYTMNGENAPDMTPFADQLFAYRVFDDHIYSDHMYGWVSMNKPAEGEDANITVFTDDYMEYAAINAAEYVGGKIFAVDAVYNLSVIEPGVWNRSVICNLGMNVIDMTFDDSTDTMYVLTKDDYYVGLYTLDLMTGAMEMVADYGYYYYAPLAIADDDNGTIYAVQYGSSSLYTLDAENGYAAVPVVYVDADGAEVELSITDSNGEPVAPGYAQSMTVVDGKLYWAYFHRYQWGSQLIAIDLEALTNTAHMYHGRAYDADYNMVDYYPMTELVGLLTLNETDYTLPEAEGLAGLMLDAENMILTVGESVRMGVSALPWNYELGALTWNSSDETVATVVDGNITAVGEGNAVITVTHGEGDEAVSAYCQIMVVEVDGNFYAYNYYSEDGNYGYMIDVDMETMDYYLLAESPADFIAGDYNGHDGYFYGYTEGGQFHRYDITTGEIVKIGAPITVTPTDMAYDYSTGLMYFTTVDYNTGMSALYNVSMASGQINKLGDSYSPLMTLACDGEGNLYSVSAYGELLQLYPMDGYIEMMYLAEGLGQLQYMQSMCWDHENEVLLWAYVEGNTIVRIDVKSETPTMLSLGDPTESGLFEFVGMFTIPETIMGLEYVPVESVTTGDMTMLTGSTKYPNVSVYPFNATSQTLELTSDNTDVAIVHADGSITGVSEGSALITGVLVDGENTFDLAFTVNVIEGADNIYGYVLTDMATYGGQYWIRIYPQDTANPDVLSYIEYIIYAEEQYDGKLYAVGYDPNDWEANWQMFIMNPETHAVYEQYDLGEGYPFVYDMTYDYATATMYVLAGASDSDTDLYAFNMETGALVPVMQTEPFFLSLAAGRDGVLYAMEKSQEVLAGYDDWGWEIYDLADAALYAINPIEGTVEKIGDTGVKSNMLASMAYDYDTDRLYWTPLYQGSSVVSGLCVVDTETGAAANLGSISAAGAQIGGLYIISDNVPEENTDALHGFVVTPGKTSVTVGASTQLNANTLPMNLDAEIEWTTSNKKVATVDENGVVTGIAQGKADITATITYNGVTMTATSTVAVLNADAAFLTWNMDQGGWAHISRADATVVTPLTQGEEANPASAIAAVDGVVYGYDTANNFFQLNTETYERTAIGAVNSDELIVDYLVNYYGYDETQAEAEKTLYGFDVRDLDYDAANGRMLVLGNVYDIEWGELNYGNGIYEVNMEDGTLTLLYTFEDIYSVMGIAVDSEGKVIYYNAYNDYYTSLDLETGDTKGIVTLQTQSYYGDTESDHGLYFDSLTGLVYHLFTSNGNFYRLLSIDPVSGALTIVSEFVGDVYYDYDSWSYVADSYQSFTFVYVEVKPCEHVWSNWVVETPATCDKNGEQYRVCEVCEEVEYVDIPALGHRYEAEVIPATCEEGGYTRYTCTVCFHYYDDEFVDAIGHNYEAVVTAPTCTEQGYTTHTCANCGDSYVDSYVDALGHSYESVVTAPNCIEQGYTTHTCSVCGDSYVDSYVSALGHTCTSVVTAPTCTEQGYTTHTCMDCGEVIINNYVDALGHNYESVVTDPTCTEEGYTTHTCTECGDSYVDSYVDALGHSFTNGKCTVCGEKDPNYNPIKNWLGKWFGNWWGNDDEEETPTEPSTEAPTEEPTETPTEPSEPGNDNSGSGIGSVIKKIFRWLFG